MTAHLDAIGLVARDLPATLAFYRRLGLDFPADADTSEHAEASAAGVRVMVDPTSTMASFDPSFDPEAVRGGGASLAFACNDPAEVDAVYADLMSAGHGSHLAPFDAPWGQRYATVLDPDGTHVDLFAALG